MKLDMSYRDKMILVGISIIIILVAGFFALIKPKYEALQADTAKYEETKTTWDGIDTKLQAIEPLKTTITDDYNSAKKTAEMFINTAFPTVNETFGNEKVSYELDQYFQTAIDESELKVQNMGLGAASPRVVSYYYYTPDVLTYSLLEAADINGTYAAEIAEKMQEGMILSTRQSVEMMAADVTLAVEGTKENLMTFLEKIEADNNAVLVNNVNIADYKFEGGLEPGPDGQVIATPGQEGTSAMSITISLYNAKEIEKPVLGD